MTDIPRGHENLPPSQTPEMLFTVAEAAEILRVPSTWLYERTRKKAIPFRKLGKYVRFTKADLDTISSGNSGGPQ